LAGRAVPIDCRISADQWDKEFARGDWNRLDDIAEYADHPLQVFERALGWLTEDGIVIVSMFEPTPGASQIWSQIMSRAIESIAATTVTDHGSGNVWDIQAMRRTR
jgi:hypothetical protein